MSFSALCLNPPPPRKVKGFSLKKRGWGVGRGVLGVRESTLVPLTTRNLHFPEFGVGVPPKFLQFSYGFPPKF